MSRYINSAAWAVAEGLGYPLLLLSATPILLRSLGTEAFGLWSLMLTLMSVGSVVSTGLSPAVIKLVAQGSRSSPRVTAQTGQGALAVAALAGGMIALLVALATAGLATTGLARLGPPHQVILAGMFAAALLWVEQFDTVVSAMLKGREQFALAAKLEIGLKLGQILIGTVAAVLTGDQLPVFGAFLLAALVRLAAKALFLRSGYLGLSLRPSLAFAQPVVRTAKWGWMQGMGSMVFATADRLFVGAALGATSLGYYAIALQLATQLHALIANAFSVVVPLVSRLDAGAGKAVQVHVLARKLAALNLVLALAGALLLAVFGDQWLRLWVGADAADHLQRAFPLLVLAYFLLSLSALPFHVLVGLGSMRFIAMVCLVGGAVSLGLTLALVPIAGIEGAALARLGFAAVALVLFVPVLRRPRAAVDGSANEPAPLINGRSSLP